MKILLTGVTGFLGSNLARAFLSSGHQVTALKRSTSDCWRIKDVLNSLTLYDVDQTPLDVPFKISGPFAAIVHTATCYGRKGESPDQVLRANTLFPLELMVTAALFSTSALFNTSTYFSTSTSLYKYLNYYSLSKKQFSEWGQQFANDGKIRFVDILLEHMYGPGDDDSKFSSFVVRSCLQNVPHIPLTLGEQKRDFIHIADVVSAYSALIEHESGRGAGFMSYEVGSGVPVRIREFVELAHRYSGSESTLDFGALPYRENEIMETSADISALRTIGWQPAIDLHDGLQEMISAERALVPTHSDKECI
jgi:nucleoside-diphosphate-sugar epimerase